MVDENGYIRASCSRNYESGTTSHHVKRPDGGCTVTNYSIKRCCYWFKDTNIDK